MAVIAARPGTSMLLKCRSQSMSVPTGYAIPLCDHPSNNDPTARLVTDLGVAVSKHSIYSVRGGFVACLGYEMCLEGLFPTKAAARAAQLSYLDK